MTKFIRLAPRVLAILIIGLFLLFSLDTPILSLGFLIHNIPTLIVAIVLMFSWKNSQLGSILFFLFFFLTLFFFNTYREIYSFLFISLPFLLTSLLFLIGWRRGE